MAWAGVRTSSGPSWSSGRASGLVEGADAGAPQAAHVSAAAERPAEVLGQHPDVGARGALDLGAVDAGPTPARARRRSARPSRFGPGRSTSTPWRASSCRRRPPTLTAETIGGICSMVPGQRRRGRRARRRRVTRPCRRCRSPRPRRRGSRWRCRARRRSSYVLGRAVRKRSSRVARPRPTRSTPVASGSRVPGVADPALAEDAPAAGDDVVRRPPRLLVHDHQAVGGHRSSLRAPRPPVALGPARPRRRLVVQPAQHLLHPSTRRRWPGRPGREPGRALHGRSARRWALEVAAALLERLGRVVGSSVAR